MSLKTALRLTTFPLSNFMSLTLNPSSLEIQLPPQLHFDLVLRYFVVWSLCSIRLRTFVLELRCDINIITVLAANGRIGLDHERSVYCLARLRPMYYFQARGKGSCYRGEWTTLAESSEAPGNSKCLISLAQIPLLNLRSQILIRDLTMV